MYFRTNIIKALPIGILLSYSVANAQQSQPAADKGATEKTLSYPEEKHFKNMRQLTFGGDNAEAYFGFDNEHITFQRTEPAKGVACDQISNA